MAPPKDLRPQARKPRGLADLTAPEIKAAEAMIAKIRAVYELYGFDPVETPLLEYSDALGKFLPDQDRPNAGVFSFQDDDEQWMSLRYDLTAPLARYVAEHFQDLPKPYRSYRSGWVFRNEKPGPGRYRQFMQFDADTVGAPSVTADAEICMMAADTLEAVGIARGDYVIRVNNRKVLDGVMEAIGLGGDDNAGRRLSVLRAIDKLDKFGPEGVALLLGAGRRDESGDFTKGADLEFSQIELVLSAVVGIRVSVSYNNGSPQIFKAFTNERINIFSNNQRGPFENISTTKEMQELIPNNSIFVQGLLELREMAYLFDAAGYQDRIKIDPSVVRGLEYYTGPVYEAELTFSITNEDGQVVRFGSVAGGGRYDGLVSRFRGEAVPATGFSIGVSRLYAALKALGRGRDNALVGPVVVLVMDRNEIARSQGHVAQLRQAGIRAELYLGGSGMKAQMKYADKRGAPCVVIQGSNERELGQVQVKDLIEGAKAAAGITSNEEWREARPAQATVAEADLVSTVRAILAHHGLGGGTAP